MFHSRACRLSRAAAVCRGSVRLPFENVRGPSSDAVLGRGAVCTRPACLNLFRIETESHEIEKEYRAKDAPASTGTVTVHRRCANGSVPSRVATPLSPHTRPHTRFAGRSHLRRWAAPYPVRPTAPPSRKVGGAIPERELPPKTAWDVPFFSDTHLYPPSRRICRSDAGRGAKDAEFRDRSASNVCPIATLRGLLL